MGASQARPYRYEGLVGVENVTHTGPVVHLPGHTGQARRGVDQAVRVILVARYLARQLAQGSSRAALLAFLLLAFGLAAYYWTAMEVQLIVNGQPHRILTHQTTVEAVLREAGIVIHPEDLVSPPLDASIAPDQAIYMRLATPITLVADGRIYQFRTQRQRVIDILTTAGVVAGPYDVALVNGQPLGLGAELQASDVAEASASPSLRNSSAYLARAQAFRSPAPVAARGGDFQDPLPVHIVLKRAIPLLLDDGRVSSTIYTTRATVGEALLEQGVVLFLGDHITPSLGSRVSAGMRIFVERSRPVEILLDGRLLKTRTQHKTVADVLAQESVALMGRDYTRPAGDAAVTPGMTIEVVRVQEAMEIEQEPIPFETVWQPDTKMELDQQRLVQEGKSGLSKRRFQVTYENGVEVGRVLEDAWIDQGPSTRIVGYGTRIVVRTLDTPDGPIEYWRKFRALVTSYTAATCGKDPDHPEYGITALGLKAGRGIVAVDPRVINLRSYIYVFGYGRGFVGDIGGRIVGRRVDLGYDEGEAGTADWYKWVDVYLLTPVPPEDKIRWVLPNWPQERRR
jgi:uncharacterized protein YabE (DUF348 family)/3D (Asp-Asp-Asp) domain-containing protein